MHEHPPAIRIENLTVGYGHSPVLRSVSLSVPQRQIVGIIGPNGAGKSTLLKAAMGLIPRSSGTIEILGERDAAARTRVAYVPQRSQIDWDFPTTVGEVVLMGRYARIGLLRRPGAQDREIATRALREVRMEAYAQRQIGELSGGQQQRVFIARALAQECEILFLDEPFVGVDAQTEQSILGILEELRAKGKTILVVNHDLGPVVRRYDRLALLNRRLVAYGPTKDVFTQELLEQTYGGRLTLLEEADATAFERLEAGR